MEGTEGPIAHRSALEKDFTLFHMMSPTLEGRGSLSFG
jgi:hypothetical protein